MSHRLQAQFDHLAETYFNGFDQDLGERELGYALSFDHDLDVFAASIGLTKTSVAAILRDEDVVLDMGGYDPESELFEPLQKLLDQCKSAKVFSKSVLGFIFSFGWEADDSKLGNLRNAWRTLSRTRQR